MWVDYNIRERSGMISLSPVVSVTNGRNLVIRRPCSDVIAGDRLSSISSIRNASLASEWIPSSSKVHRIYDKHVDR